MQADDVPTVSDLDHNIFPDNGFGVRQLHAELRDGHGLVARCGDIVEGYCLLRVDGSLVEITRLAVRDGSRGKGVGRLLLSCAIHYSRERTVSLQVHKENAAAFLLYSKSGFRIVGESGDTWVMQLLQNAAPADCYLLCAQYT